MFLRLVIEGGRLSKAELRFKIFLVEGALLPVLRWLELRICNFTRLFLSS